MLVVFLASTSAFSIETTPIVRIDAAGGQFFLTDFQGSNTSFAGSGDWFFSDGLKFSESDLLIPEASGQYLRRAQVNQIAGGGTLISETLDDSAALRWVHSWGAWSVKPNASFKNELVAINNGEALGAGVFDSNEGDAGIEAEWKGEALKSLRQDFSVSRTDYYHYRPGSSFLFGEELLLSDQALNLKSYDYSVAGDLALWNEGLLTFSAEGTFLDYGSQHVVEPGAAANSYVATGRTRGDWMGTWLASATQKLPKVGGDWTIEGSASLSADYVLLSSNQNDVDSALASQGTVHFTPDYYSYGEVSAGPVLTMTINGKLRLSLTYNYAHRNYRDRPVQDASGAYSGSKVWTDVQTLSYSFSYPLRGGLSAQISGGYVSADSNMHYENFYLYNYHYPYYFAGFGYAL